MDIISVKNIEIKTAKINTVDYICLTDIARSKNDDTNAVIGNWLRNRNTIEYLGIWEKLYNPKFNPLEFEGLRMTAKTWREKNPTLHGNIRDYATINQLICLSNMENLNAVFINEGMPQDLRLLKLNKIAIQQMQILEDSASKKYLK